MLETEDGEGPERLPAPAGPDELAGRCDLTLSRPAVEADNFAAFERWLARAAARRGLRCALLHGGVVDEAVRRLDDGRLSVGYHLDYFADWHRDDVFARLARAVEDAGGRSVNGPGRARLFTDKAAAHAELRRRGLGTPPAVVFRPGSPERPLTDAERRRLRLDEPDAAVYVKPANGCGGRNVHRCDRTDGDALLGALRSARGHDPSDAYLVQREVRPPELLCDDGARRPAYWRVVWCLGDVSPFWWWPLDRVPSGGLCYRPLSTAEVLRHGLRSLFTFVADLADLSGLDWFSTEVCLGDGADAGRHVVVGPDGRARPLLAVDYLNDQCDVDVQSRWPGGVPEAFVRRWAERFAVEAARLRDGAGHAAAARAA